METIILRSDLQERLEKNAQQQAKSLNDVLNEAVEHYLQEQQRTKLDQEIAAYQTLHPSLKQSHLGQWIAIHHSKLVDHDVDGPTLYRRVRANYGRISVLIRQVTIHPIEEVWLHTPTTGRLNL